MVYSGKKKKRRIDVWCFMLIINVVVNRAPVIDKGIQANSYR
jgi:hypothetical protein